MKYLSWDVGVKNMAYALLEKNDDVCKIIKIGIINLVDKRDTCMFKLRTGKSCGKIARFKSLDINNVEKCYCKVHSAKAKIEAIENNTYNCVKCGKEAKINILNREEWSWCDKHEKLSKKILTQFRCKKITGQNCTQQPMQELITELTNKLDEHEDFLDVEGVWIENQPALLNPTIKTIASALYTYFIIRGCVDKNKIKFVKFASPLNKLKVSKSTTTEALNKAKNDREYYSIEKGLSKIYVRTLITSDELEVLEDVKQKNDGKDDDICDAYLQGFHHIFEGNIPEHYQEKLRNIPESHLEVKKIKSKK